MWTGSVFLQPPKNCESEQKEVIPIYGLSKSQRTLVPGHDPT